MLVARDANEAQDQRLDLELSAEPSSVTAARHAVASFAAGRDARHDDLAIATTEAVANAVSHAYRDSKGSRRGGVRVRAWIDRGDLVVTVSDEGVGMRPHPLGGGRGMGLPLIGAVADRLELESSERGTAVSMRFRAASS